MNALLETFSCVYSEIMFTIISFFQKLIKGGGLNKSGGLENFSNINKREGDNYSVLESKMTMGMVFLESPGTLGLYCNHKH